MDQSTAIYWLSRFIGIGAVFMVIFYFYGRGFLEWLSRPHYGEQQIQTESAKRLQQMDRNVAEKKVARSKISSSSET